MAVKSSPKIQSKGGILGVVPSLGEASEVWLTRSFELLGPSLCGVATRHVNHNVPIKQWGISWEYAKLPFRLRRRLGLTLGGRPLDFPEHRIVSLCRMQKVQTVIVHFASLALQLTRAWDTISQPVLVHVHGADVTWDLKDHSGARLHPPGYREAILDLAQRVWLVATPPLAERLRLDGFPPNRIFEKTFGVPVSGGNQESRKPRKSRTKILFLGRLVDFKGPEMTIQAFNLLRKSGCDASLDIAGDGPLLIRCRRLADESPFRQDITLHGAVDANEGDRLRATSDIFTAHSCVGKVTGQIESFGVAFVEAAAAGLPVVTGNCGGPGYLVREGVTGRLFEPSNVEQHAALLKELVEDVTLRMRLGNAGSQDARERFSLEQERQDWERILSAVAQ